MWSAVFAPALPHSAQMVALPSLSICLRLALYMGSLYGDVMSLMLLAPLLRCGCFQHLRRSEVCVPHTSDQSVKAAGHRKEVDTIRLLCS